MGRYNTAFSTLKMVLVAAIPKAREKTTTARKPGFFRRVRAAYCVSDQRVANRESIIISSQCDVSISARSKRGMQSPAFTLIAPPSEKWSLLLIPQIPKEFYGPRPMAGVVVVCIREGLEVPANELAEQRDPIRQIFASVHPQFVPGFRLLLDRLAIPEPPHIGKVCGDQVEVILPFPRARNPALVD